MNEYELESCTFVGPEPIYFDFGFNEEDPLCEAIKNTLRIQVMNLYKNGVRTFYSDCEIGVGMWAAEVLLELMGQHSEVELICVLPFEEQAKTWDEPFRDRYYRILEKSTYNELICTRFADDCYRRCGKYLIDHSGYLLAVYDNGKVTRLENAALSIANAKKRGRTVVYIDPYTARVTPYATKA